MGLRLEPVIERPAARHLMSLDIDIDVFLRTLHSLDGRRRVQVVGLPDDVRCVGLTTDRMRNTVTVYLEAEEWREVPHGAMPPQLELSLREYFGDAVPQG